MVNSATVEQTRWPEKLGVIEVHTALLFSPGRWEAEACESKEHCITSHTLPWLSVNSNTHAVYSRICGIHRVDVDQSAPRWHVYTHTAVFIFYRQRYRDLSLYRCFIFSFLSFWSGGWAWELSGEIGYRDNPTVNKLTHVIVLEIGKRGISAVNAGSVWEIIRQWCNKTSGNIFHSSNSEFLEKQEVLRQKEEVRCSLEQANGG